MRIAKLRVEAVGPFDKPLVLEFPPGTRPDRADTVILTGQNGTGKSTLLYAIAACFGSPELWWARRRTDESEAAIEVEVAGSTLATLVAGPGQSTVNPFGGAPLSAGGVATEGVISRGTHLVANFWSEARNPTVESVALSASLLFAYSAMRSTPKAKPLVIMDLAGSPLVGAADFSRYPQPEAFEQWVANTATKRALAAGDGDSAGAERYDRVLTEAQDAIASVIGATFSFAVIREPLSVVGVVDGNQIPLSLLPDGAKSILSWLGDLLMRLDRLPKPEGMHGVDLPFVLLLDEVEVHLHPAWQRRILPMIEGLFPNAQIFLSTHSPFVIGSASDATIVLLRQDGTVSYEYTSQMGKSYTAIAEELMGVSSEFDVETEQLIGRFEALKAEVLLGRRSFGELESMAYELGERGEELASSMRYQIERVRRQTAA